MFTKDFANYPRLNTTIMLSIFFNNVRGLGIKSFKTSIIHRFPGFSQIKSNNHCF